MRYHEQVRRVTEAENPDGQEAFELMSFIREMNRVFHQAQEDHVEKGLSARIRLNKSGLKAIVGYHEYPLDDGRVRKVAAYWPLAGWQTQNQMILLRVTQKGGRDGPLEYFLAPTPSGINAHPEFSDKDELAQAIISTINNLEAGAGWERCEVKAPRLMTVLREQQAR